MHLRAILVALALVAAMFASTASAHTFKVEWWEGLTMEERLEGQLHLRAHTRTTLRRLELAPQLIRLEPRASARAERKAERRLKMLRTNIGKTRDALRAAEAAAAAAATSSSSSGGSYSGDGLPQYVIDCESGGDPDAVNPTSGAYGWAQIMPQHWSPTGWGYGSPGVCYGLDRYNAADYAECVRRILGSSGLGAWDCA